MSVQGPLCTPIAMSTLVEVLSGGSAANALTGVKRPLLGNPTTVPTQPPAFRGAPNEPGKAIKVPKLSGGNRQDRGTNVTLDIDTGMIWGFLERSGKKAQNRRVSISSEEGDEEEEEEESRLGKCRDQPRQWASAVVQEEEEEEEVI